MLINMAIDIPLPFVLDMHIGLMNLMAHKLGY